MNFANLFKAFDTMVAVREMARRVKVPREPDPSLAQPGAVQGLAGQIEARLSTVVVAALKEAFDRDHARLELERQQLEEQRHRAEEALRHELRRQAVDRELGRLRLLAGTALIGWIASVLLLGWRIPLASLPARLAMAAGWFLLLAALGAAFTAMGRIGEAATQSGSPSVLRSSTLPMWLLLVGLAMTALMLLL